MKTYDDLRLKDLMAECGLSFAHYTFLPGQKCLEVRMRDMPARYWKGGKKPEVITGEDGWEHLILDGEEFRKDFSYIIFKNADDVNHAITDPKQEINSVVYIQHRLDNGIQKRKVCIELAKQLDSDYIVECPTLDTRCIKIVPADETMFMECDNFDCCVMGGTGEYFYESDPKHSKILRRDMDLFAYYFSNHPLIKKDMFGSSDGIVCPITYSYDQLSIRISQNPRKRANHFNKFINETLEKFDCLQSGRFIKYDMDVSDELRFCYK